VAEWTGCAFRDSQKKDMLKAYSTMRAARVVVQGPNQPFGRAGEQIPTIGSWNEAVVDGIYWNKVTGTNIEAFFLAEVCVQNTDCKNRALKVVSDYKDMYGFAPPLVGFTPFSEDAFFVLDSVTDRVLI